MVMLREPRPDDERARHAPLIMTVVFMLAGLTVAGLGWLAYDAVLGWLRALR